MIFGLAVSSSAMFLVPVAHGATLAAAMLLIGQQIIGDGCAAIFQIEHVSLRQSVTTEGLLGRVNASTEFVRLGATLAGSLIGGWLGGVFGVKLVLVCAACGSLLSTLLLWFSPVNRLRAVSQSSSFLPKS